MDETERRERVVEGGKKKKRKKKKEKGKSGKTHGDAQDFSHCQDDIFIFQVFFFLAHFPFVCVCPPATLLSYQLNEKKMKNEKKEEASEITNEIFNRE